MVNNSKAAQPLYLLLIVLSQVFCSYFLAFKNNWTDVFDKLHLSIYSTTIFSLFFFFFINNLISPSNSNDEGKSKKLFNLVFSILFGGAALLSGYLSFYKLGLLVSLILMLQLLYALFIKRLPILGNVLIASLNSMSLLVLIAFDPNIKPYLILAFTIFIFGIHFIIDFIKDILNNRDQTISGNYTLPAIAGNKVSRIFLIAFLFIYILVLTTSVRLIMVKYFSAPLSYVFLAYNILCVGIPLFRILSKLQTGNESADYKYLYQVACYTLVTGIFSMMFF
jgi:4-hydroxybenzoate polyprenyltransferase